jgi:DNA-directed RNA polymerase subunit RPC12/RpoP
MVVPNARKLCARCSRDLTHERRMKDAAGEYYCPPCWSAGAAESGRQAAFLCATCGESFSLQDLSEEGDRFVCRTCLAARDLNPETLLTGASDLGGERSTAGPDAETFAHYQARKKRERQLRTMLWIGGATAVVAIVVVVVIYVR